MINEVLTPGVQNADNSYRCAEMFRIICEFLDCLGDRTKEKIVHDPLVHRDQGIEFRRDSEDHMEILNGEKVLTARLDPSFFPQGLAFRTVPISAGVIRYLQMAAMIALILMAAKDCGSADLDGAYDPQMIAGQPMGFSIRRAVLTEDVRHLKAARCSHPLSGLRSLFCYFIKGAYDLGKVQPTDMQIDGGRCGGSMPQKQLNMVEARSRFNEVGGKAVP
jgi:hypothetical protein